MISKRFISYFKYLFWHKWFVFKACLHLDIPIWRALLHDWTKFRPLEWSAYANFFYASDGSRNKVEVGKIDPDFDRAWLHHQRKNKHHWQFWVLIFDDGGIRALAMPDQFILEMIADWEGAGNAIRKIMRDRGEPEEAVMAVKDVPTWWHSRKELMILHPETKTRIDLLVGEKYADSLRSPSDAQSGTPADR